MNRRALGGGLLALVAALWSVACEEEPVPEPEPKVAAAFDPTLAGGFFSFPWPCDTRVTADGAPDVASFPNHGNGSLVDDYKQAVLDLVVGFGTNQHVHVRFDGPLDEAAFPTEQQTYRGEGPVLLLDIDPESPEYGRTNPVQLHWDEAGTTYVEPFTLTAFPSVGFPLRSSTTYGFVVLDTLRDPDGARLIVHPDVQAALAGEGDAAVAGAFALLGPALDDAGIDRASVAVATVFTTQDATAELHALRDWVANPAHLPAPEVESLGHSEEHDHYGVMTVYEGTYTTPVFQRGDPPYATEGGGFVFEGGEPVIQRTETVRFSLTVPSQQPPAAGHPVVIALPGTGGTIFDHFIPMGINAQGQLLSEWNVATFSFEPPLHGGRGEPWGAQPDLHTYNVFNPESFRSNFRQEAVDASVAIRFLRQSLGPYLQQHEGRSLDTTRLGFFGHSQGAHIGTLLAAVEPELDPVYVNGMGGVIAYTFIERKDMLDIEQAVRLAIGEDDEMTVFHPVIGLAQLLADIADPINYARQWFLEAAPGEGTSVMQSNGYLDTATPWITANGLAVAGGNPLIEPVEWDFPEMDWIGRDPVALPFSGNLEAADGEAVTGGVITRAALGHHVVTDDLGVAQTCADFLATGLFDGLPTAQ